MNFRICWDSESLLMYQMLLFTWAVAAFSWHCQFVICIAELTVHVFLRLLLNEFVWLTNNNGRSVIVTVPVASAVHVVNTQLSLNTFHLKMVYHIWLVTVSMMHLSCTCCGSSSGAHRSKALLVRTWSGVHAITLGYSITLQSFGIYWTLVIKLPSFLYLCI